MAEFIDLRGQRFGRLRVIELDSSRELNSKRYRTKWICVCDCGKETIVASDKLRSGHTKSCGCLRGEATGLLLRTHGLTYHPLYSIWCGIKQRCYQPNHEHYHCYGGRGIQMCDSWKIDFVSFYEWAISSGWSKGLTIDRIDVDGNYCPENCRLADIETQANNKRNTRYITAFGKTMSLSQWSREYAIPIKTLSYRLNSGWPVEIALAKPSEKQGINHET